MCTSWKCFLLLLLLIGLHGLVSAQQCQSQGQCMGGVLLGLSFTNYLENCIIQGRQVEGAKFVTWKPLGPGLCLAFDSCLTRDADVAGAVTSCLNCRVPGSCVGKIVKDQAVEGEAECGKLCLDTPACAWFTYLEEQEYWKYCLMFADCNTLTTYCKNCYSSPESCLEDPTALLPILALPPTSNTTTAPPSTTTTASAPAAMNKIFYIDGETGKTTVVSLDGLSENCVLEDYPANSNYPSALTYINGMVLACGGHDLYDADRCWQFNGSSWSPMPNSKEHHCSVDTPNVVTSKGWWITGRLQYGDDYDRCTSSWTTSEIFDGEDWVVGPTLPGNGYSPYSCVVNLSPNQTMLIGGSRTRNDVWIYDWSTEEWTRTDSLMEGRYIHGCVHLGDEGVLVAGGYTKDGGRIYTVVLYDPIAGTWSSKPDIPGDMNPVDPILLNWDGQVLVLLRDMDQVYKWSQENGELSVLDTVKLPESFSGFNYDKATLVPDNFVLSCV